VFAEEVDGFRASMTISSGVIPLNIFTLTSALAAKCYLTASMFPTATAVYLGFRVVLPDNKVYQGVYFLSILFCRGLYNNSKTNTKGKGGEKYTTGITPSCTSTTN